MTSDLVKQIHVVIKWPTNNMENIAIAYFFLNKPIIVSVLCRKMQMTNHAHSF